MTKFSKKCKRSNSLGTFCPNLGKNEFFTKIGQRHFLASIVPLLKNIKMSKKIYAKYQQKLMRQF